MATEQQTSERIERLQEAIENGEISQLSLHRGRGQNQDTRVIDLDTILYRVLIRELDIRNIEEAAACINGGDYTLRSQLTSGGFGPSYSFKVAPLKDQNLKNELMERYGLNITNPILNGRGGPNPQFQSIFGQNTNGNGNGNGNNFNQNQMNQLWQMLNNQGFANPRSNDLSSLIQNAGLPNQIQMALISFQQQIQKDIEIVKREFENSKTIHNNEMLNSKTERTNRDIEHKKEMNDITAKYESIIREMQNKFDNQIKDMQRDHKDDLSKIENRYINDLKDIRQDFDRRLSQISTDQKMEMMSIKSEANNGNSSNKFLETWMMMTQQEKMEVTKQLAESKSSADSNGTKLLELLVMSQNNNPMTKVLEVLLTKSLEKNNDPNNLKAMDQVITWIERIKGDTGEEKTGWAKIGEYLLPALANIAQGVTTGFINKKMGGPVPPPTVNPYMQMPAYTPQYPPATMQQTGTSYPSPTSAQTGNVTPFPKTTPPPVQSVQTSQPIIPKSSMSNPIDPSIIDMEKDINNDFIADLDAQQQEEEDVMPNMGQLQAEWDNPETQNYITSRIFPIFIQDDPNIIAIQLFEAIGELDQRQLCPQIMNLVHMVEDYIYDKDYQTAFMVVNMIAGSMQLTLTPEQAQKTSNIFECYSKILKDSELQEGINNDK